VVELPANLVVDGFRPIRLGKASGSHGIPGGTECVRAHVADRGRLTRGPGGGRRGGIPHFSRTDAPGKPTAYRLGGVQLSPRERAGAGDESPRAVIIWRNRLEYPESALRTVGGPGGDEPSVRLA
jgi:hypothetical protein